MALGLDDELDRRPVESRASAPAGTDRAGARLESGARGEGLSASRAVGVTPNRRRFFDSRALTLALAQC
jgi:hypothetical protein